MINTDNIIIDSKSGYSGAGKIFDLNNIKNKLEFNFYNYNTNEHRHICEIQQELDKHSDQKVIFSFNPHILPIYRGLMSTIYCDLQENIIPKDVEDCLNKFAQNLLFVDILDNKVRGDFFKVQNTNKCLIKLYNQKSKSKIIIVSLIDNLLKGAAGQAVQCANLMFGFKENIGF
jgi:N-acetyl-gamma-glutamyl-phosphate reductase